ncbi:MAG: EAL domain-containing protein [Lachnospiraceae bacterium]|nr:EAL domain-containing protein [Lachnospiraceae bacterium]
MFTWNFQFISKARLADTFNQLGLNSGRGEVLIRIHTAIHEEAEAVDLAKFIKDLVPKAHIFGTSTSAVIGWGRLMQNQCVVSVTQMDEGRVRTAMVPAFNGNTELPIPPEELAQAVKDAVISEDTGLMLTFTTAKYADVYDFVDKCNDCFPGVQMIGGIANTSEISFRTFLDSGFVFDENGFSTTSVLVASLSGKELECLSGQATGTRAVGEECTITDTFGTAILSIGEADAASAYRRSIGEELGEHPELTNYFPFVYSEFNDIPIMLRYTDRDNLSDLYPETVPANRRFYDAHPGLDTVSAREVLSANHNIRAGKKLKRAFICDRKIVADNRTMFQRIENFEKAETLFGYSCTARSIIYSNCIKWELSIYENSNLCGCITEGEITCVGGRNTFANCSFVVAALGEKTGTQDFNPYVFSRTESLSADNRPLVEYLINTESRLQDKNFDAPESLRTFVRECERFLMYQEQDDIPNEASLNMDIKLHGYDRICMINVLDTSSMKIVFSPQMISKTYVNYLNTCRSFSGQKKYRFYLLSEWQVAIAAPSYLISLDVFAEDMEKLQKELFKYSEDYISIVPIFCVMYDCTVENLPTNYASARVEMMKRNIQFSVFRAGSDQLDEASIRERYRMVNVINYAIDHDGVLPFFQGIYDNRKRKITHYEALMRLRGEDGTIYNPGSFLDVARSFGLLYDSLSRIMIRKVFDLFEPRDGYSVSINLGIRDIRNRELLADIYDFLSTSRHPDHYIFEILENEEVGDYNTLVSFVDKIHELGGLISIDDFGSGYSNLQHILSIHSDFIKIDGSIIRNCYIDRESENLVALISGWKNLSSRNIRIIAEFVENEEIQRKLTSYNVDYSQGYLFSKPAPLSEE